MLRPLVACFAVALCCTSTASRAQPATQAATTRPAAMPPAVRDRAPDFTLATLDDQPVQLSTQTADGPVVLVVLRGWPGYQCPICTRQVGQLVTNAKRLTDRNARVLLVYPGPADNLKAHAAEFASEKNLPANFTFVLDPDYRFTNAYGLRWDASGETAYPSTFVIDKGGTVRMATVSQSHDGRTTIDQILAALDLLN